MKDIWCQNIALVELFLWHIFALADTLMQVLTKYFSESKAGIGGGREEAKPVYRAVKITLK